MRQNESPDGAKRSFAHAIIIAMLSRRSLRKEDDGHDFRQPCIQFNGSNVHVVLRTSRHEGKVMQGAGRDREEDKPTIPLPAGARFVGININNGNWAVGTMSPAMQADVERKLLGAASTHRIGTMGVASTGSRRRRRTRA